MHFAGRACSKSYKLFLVGIYLFFLNSISSIGVPLCSIMATRIPSAGGLGVTIASYFHNHQAGDVGNNLLGDGVTNSH